MKQKDFSETKTKAVPELERLLGESRTKLRNLEFDLAAGKVQNIKEIRVLRKSVAQLMTLIRSAQPL
jgi:ribosomal protein L29